MRKRIDISGQRFGKLIAVSRCNTGSRHTKWTCRCDCGATTDVRLDCLRSGASKSCGCSSVVPPKSHGMSGTPDYKTWIGMIARCTDQNHKSYHNYGGRGISVCERWANSIEMFIADMGPRPTQKHTIDRVDNDGNYEPGNCRWATTKEQGRNKRVNRYVTYRGESKCVAEWAEQFGIHKDAIYDRLSSGWSIEEALTTPILTENSMRAKRIAFCGRSLSVTEWAEQIGITARTLRRRLKYMPIEKALTLPKQW